jgi:hypothetical protein
LAAPYLNIGAWVTTTTANTTTVDETLGALRFDGGKVYRFARMTGGAATAGQAVTYVADSTTSVALCGSMTTANTTAALVAGIAETALTSGNYGWITVYGPATALVNTGALINDALVPATTAGALTQQDTLYTAAGAGTTGSPQTVSTVVALTTGVIAGSSVFVRCM